MRAFTSPVRILKKSIEIDQYQPEKGNVVKRIESTAIVQYALVDRNDALNKRSLRVTLFLRFAAFAKPPQPPARG